MSTSSPFASANANARTNPNGEEGYGGNEGTGGDSRIEKIKASVDDVKKTMVHNIDSLLERGERLELLDSKTAILSDTSSRFQRGARHIRYELCHQSMRKKAIIAGVLAIGIGLLILLFWVFISAHKDQDQDPQKDGAMTNYSQTYP